MINKARPHVDAGSTSTGVFFGTDGTSMRGKGKHVEPIRRVLNGFTDGAGCGLSPDNAADVSSGIAFGDTT